MRTLVRCLSAIMFAVACLVAHAVHGQVDEAQFQSDLKTIASHPTRVIGSDGYGKTLEYLREQIKSMGSSVELAEQQFDVLMPQTESATLTLADGGVQKIYPFWPAQVRVNATPTEGISGKLVYLGHARFEEIDPAAIKDQIAVIEASAGEDWAQAAYFGARAIVVLGGDDVDHQQLSPHDLTIPINIPRFYLPKSELSDALRAGRVVGDATLKAAVIWRRVQATSLLALVKPAQARPAGWDAAAANPGAMVISVPFESMSIVPELAPGAGQAVQTAAGLALLRDLAKQPLDRPVLVFFGGADSVNFLATRHMFSALADDPADWRTQLTTQAEQRAVIEEDLAHLRELTGNPGNVAQIKDRLQRTRVIDRITTLVKTDETLSQEKLFRLRTLDARDRTPEQDRQRQELESHQLLLNRLRVAIAERPQELNEPEMSAAANDFVQRAIDRLSGDPKQSKAGLLHDFDDRKAQLEQRIALNDWLRDRLGKRTLPDGKPDATRLIECVVGIDLSDRGVRVGPMYFGRYQQLSNISHILDYAAWFQKLEAAAIDSSTASAPNDWFTAIRNIVDFEPLRGSRSPQSWLAAPIAIPTELCQTWGVPGFTMMTLDDLRLRRDTPADTLDHVDVSGAILPQLHAVRALLWHAWNDPTFKGPIELKPARAAVSGQVVSMSAGDAIPNIPREGFLVTYNHTDPAKPGKIPYMQTWPSLAGMRRSEVHECDSEGNYRFEGLSRLGGGFTLGFQAYQLDYAKGGAIVATSDLAQQGATSTIVVDIHQDVNPLRSLVFQCEEFSIVGLYDPRFLQSLREVQMLDARRNADPQRYNIAIVNNMMAGFVEPEMRAHLLFRYGRVGNRLVLVNMKPGEANNSGGDAGEAATLARGFTVDQLRHIGPLALVTAEDFYELDKLRLETYRKAGVSSAKIDSIDAESRRQIDNASRILQQPSSPASDQSTTQPIDSVKPGLPFIEQATGAWANQARVYGASQAMANDVIRAAIFLLLLCVPFSFCMERLIIGSPNIYRQIAGGFVIFGIMTLALNSFHPAFKISSSPLVVILSFAIILMSIVVITVVYGKFDTELKKIRSGRGSAQGASFARAGVMMAAVLLGIANMRKRKFRTALTSITIVLITFAVLCFTSATQYLDTTALPTGQETRYPGVMLRQRGFRRMPSDVLQHLQATVHAIASNAGLTTTTPPASDASAPPTMVEHWWNVNEWDPKDQIHITAVDADAAGAANAKGGAIANSPPRIFPAQSILGLSPGESQLHGTKDIAPIARVIGPDKFARLESGETDIIYFSDSIAKQLQVKEGDRVRIGGISLEVAGIFPADKFDQEVVTLGGEPMAPLKYAPDALDGGGRRLNDNSSFESLDLDPAGTGAELSSTYEHVSATQFVIMPARTAQRMPGNPSLRSVTLRLPDEAAVKQYSGEFSKRFALTLFAGYDDGVRMVTAGNLASVSGAGGVAIPLAIAGLIIFNTMMGSIAERRREIHIYTSLGLAPMHVGALFLAEAMTYGLIGTVFGYVIGQGVGTLLLHLGWLGNVTLNYSGTSAMLTMGLILLIVLLSALVPARLASKLAAPSIERTWKVPLPKGDEIIAQLPFTISRTAAQGALAYLAEFFDAHREGSIGKFSAGPVEAFNFKDESGRTSRGIKTIIWLTPFDLGVRQHLMLLIHPGQYEDIYEVQVVLQRLSGDDGSWYRMNRTFLTELRKQFLQWRSLTPSRMLEYVEESKAKFLM